MKVTLLQTDILLNEPTANMLMAEKMIMDAEKSDLYVLPEMFATGFITIPFEGADADGKTLAWLKQMARKYDAAFACSVAVKEKDEEFYNRFYFVKPDGKVTKYDKRHLFSYGGEGKYYHQGEDCVTVEWCGVRFLLQICYDLRFPVFSRNNKEEHYDAAIYVANWPESRRKPWDILLRARAIENQCYVIAVNRVGDDNMCHYNGGSAIIDAYGNDVVTLEDNVHGTASAVLDMEVLQRFRKKFPVLNDADK
ncbi:MAG: nitrilase family protein [Prevotella sp.]|nr:nitrilase family protein [Candidatus Prevotella equi]